MAEPPIKTEELKKLVLMAKQRPMNYAYNPGKKQPDLLLVDKKKPPEALGRTAKKDGEGTKVSFGAFAIEGRKVVVNASQYITGFGKSFGRYLKSLGVMLPVEVLDPDGNVIESDVPDLPPEVEAADAPPPGAAAAAAMTEDADTDEEKRADLAGRLRALQGPVAALGPAGAPVRKAVAMAVGFLREGAVDKAADSIARIETALAKAPAPAAPEPRAEDAVEPKELIARAATLKQKIATLADPRSEAVRKQLTKSLALLKSGDIAGAEVALRRAEAATEVLARAEPAGNEQATPEDMQEVPAANSDAAREQPQEGPIPETPSAEAPQGVSDPEDREVGSEPAVEPEPAAAETLQTEREEAFDTATLAAFREVHKSWRTTRNGIFVDIEKLKMAIEVKAGAIDGLAPVARNLDVLHDHIDALDDTLEGALAALAKTTDSSEAARLKQQALDVIGGYRRTLDTAFFQAVDQNGFTKTQIRGRTLEALSGVERALTA